ncbi:hypothetical protein BG004_004291 [Podila humilis]|nr:hypothetical protein BG004_004291 [Podila humilis]
MTEATDSTSSSGQRDSHWEQQRDTLVHEIASTNQVNVQWVDLCRALKEKLDQAIESSGLAYTDPFLTNPITTTLAAESNSVPDLSHLTAVPVTVLTSATEPEVETTHPESKDETGQDHQQRQEFEQTQEQGMDTLSRDEASQDMTASVGTTESASNNVEEVSLPGTVSPELGVPTPMPVAREKDEDDSVEVTPPTVSSNGPATPPRMVPVSKETLILETPAGYRARIHQLLDTFVSPPFTIQRVCELLDQPTEHHCILIKYLRAVEKVLMITSSINEFSNPAYSGPSALDGEQDSTEQTASATLSNGDICKNNPDYSLITTAVVSRVTHGTEEQAEEEKEDTERDQQSQGPSDHTQGPYQGEPVAEAMEVEKTSDIGDDMDVDAQEMTAEGGERSEEDEAKVTSAESQMDVDQD